ncbi:MAG: DNA translocase FtsK [Cytophagales bacterium]|nr:DNA translocase FtsK [Cytophagales bacterium]
MAKNTYKSNRFETPKSRKKSKQWRFSFDGLSDPRFKMCAGLSLMLLSVFLLIAFVSFIWNGAADQSLVESWIRGGEPIQRGEVRNWLGLVGAWAGYRLIYQWFGVAAFLLTPLLFALGVKLVFKKTLFSFYRSFAFLSFFTLWVGVFFGFFHTASDPSGYHFSFLSGGIGYWVSSFLYSFLGWGTLIFLLFVLAVFIIYFFNINSLDFSQFTSLSVRKPKHEDVEGKAEKMADEPHLRKSVKQQIEQSAAPAVAMQKTEETEEEKPEEAEISTTQSWDVDIQEEKRKQEAKKEKKSREDRELELSVEDTTDHSETLTKREAKKAEKAREVLGDQECFDPTLELSQYKFPMVDMLIDRPMKNVKVSDEELEMHKNRIVETLINFKIGISSIRATIGPTVTLYEIVPEAGVKISKIKNLEDDIALSLSALGIRIIAPIPGKGTIGIEVPNKHKEVVSMRSVIATDKFLKSSKELPVALGKTISNEIYVADLAKMPHLLMAGATGQGKSVGINVILASLLYKKHPAELKFVMVDPKKVELTLYNKIEKHYLAKLPDSEEAIITDTSKVVHTLNALCIEMDNRYDMLKEAGCRKLSEYNAKFKARRLNPEKGHKFLPYIVVVIDELADLMMTAGREVEAPIARLAQLARAVGIHMVVATQRPSVNVITGLIKANFPARVSFRVTSKIDSRTILDAGGAEQLIGRGDMLLSDGSEMIRLQCAFVDTPEIEEICHFIGEQQAYASAYLLPEYVGEENEAARDVDLSKRDVLFEEAARVIVSHQQGSTSLLQRKLKLGYNRAGRIIDQLEAAGVVGPFEGSKAREVLVPDDYALEQMLENLKSTS